jgi:hypothetical protein
MCFSSNTLLQVPWKESTVEYGITLQLEGFDIDFAPEATVWVETPTEIKGLLEPGKQQTNRFKMLRKYAQKLFFTAFKQRSAKFFDILIDLITPRATSMLLFVLGICFVSVSSWKMGWITFSFVWPWLTVTGLGTVYVLVGMLAAETDRQLFKSALYLPVYLLWKFKVFVQKFFTRRKKKDLVLPKDGHNLLTEEVEEF